jgi:hypothetical protein
VTYQRHDREKAQFLARLANDNYDYLYKLAKEADTSIAKVLNRVIEEHKSQSGIKLCRTYRERIMVN